VTVSFALTHNFKSWILILDSAYSYYHKTSLFPDNTVANMGYWVRENWVWNVVWTAVLTEAEAGSAQKLSLLLDQLRPNRGEDDQRWLAHAPGFFTVKTSLLNSLVLPALDAETIQALKLLWLNN
jgi:hypothetical protein